MKITWTSPNNPNHYNAHIDGFHLGFAYLFVNTNQTMRHWVFKVANANMPLGYESVVEIANKLKELNDAITEKREDTTTG